MASTTLESFRRRDRLTVGIGMSYLVRSLTEGRSFRAAAGLTTGQNVENEIGVLIEELCAIYGIWTETL